MHQNTLKERRRRRSYTKQFKAELVAQCMDANISLASLAIENDINPNVLRRWVIEHERYGQHTLSEDEGQKVDHNEASQRPWQSFIPVRTDAQPSSRMLPAPAIGRSDGPLTVQLQGRGITISVFWPSTQAQALAHWVRDVLA